MNAVSDSPAAAPSLRRLPFTVGIAPSFANPLVTAPANDPAYAAGKGGLLFGLRDSAAVVVKRSYPFDLQLITASGQALEAATSAACANADFKGLSLIGWYVQRTTAGLLESDIEVHNRNFLKASDLAIVIRPEGGAEIVCEIYSRSIEGLLSEEGHRWGLLRLTRQKLLEEFAEVTMRAQMRDDFFMRAYSQPYENPDGAAPAIWKRALGRFRRGPKEQGLTGKGIANTVAPESALAFRTPLETPVTPELRNPDAPRTEATKPADQVKPENIIPADLAKPDHVIPADRLKPDLIIPADRPKPDLIIPADRPKHDPAMDITREMPRALALKALGLDSDLHNAPPQLVVAQEKNLAPAPSAVAATPQQQIAPRQELSPVTAEEPHQRKRRRKSPWILTAVIFGLAAAGTFAVVRYRVFLTSIVSSNGPAATLGLRLEGQGDRILITWDRKGANALTAISGQLVIADGAQHKALTLDPSQIVNGSVLYRPNSADLTFRLQMTGRDGKQTEETLRVLDASRTNNDGIKVMTVDGATELPPKTQLKPAVPRKDAVAISPGNAAIATAGEAVQPAPPPASELPPQPATQKEAVTPAEGGNVTSSTASTPAANRPESPDGPSETVIAPSAQVKETIKAPEIQTPSTEPLVPVPAPAAVEKSPAPAAVEKSPAPPPMEKSPAPSNPLRSYIAPQPTRQIMPNVRMLPPGLTSVNAQVEVTVSIDAQGRVSSARVTKNTGKVSSALSGAVLAAARAWTFNPATMNGKAVMSEHAIVFNFKPAAR